MGDLRHFILNKTFFVDILVIIKMYCFFYKNVNVLEVRVECSLFLLYSCNISKYTFNIFVTRPIRAAQTFCAYILSRFDFE